MEKLFTDKTISYGEKQYFPNVRCGRVKFIMPWFSPLKLLLLLLSALRMGWFRFSDLRLLLAENCFMALALIILQWVPANERQGKKGRCLRKISYSFIHSCRGYKLYCKRKITYCAILTRADGTMQRHKNIHDLVLLSQIIKIFTARLPSQLPKS